MMKILLMHNSRCGTRPVNGTALPAGVPSGLTMLEVIFAMVVILVGMVGVGLMIPLAGRQAADSYQITQGLAAGESALAMVETTRVVQPTVETPWCLIDDSAGVGYSLGSMQAAYDQVALTFPAPSNQLDAAIAQNEVIGIGFCIDPLFWGYQPRVAGNPLPPPFVRNRFPGLDEFADPVSLNSTPRRTPRLLRGSLSDPRSPSNWLSQPTSVRVATMEGGDLVQATPTSNRAANPLRAVYASSEVGLPLMSNPATPTPTSWMMTVTPSENTPIISLNLAAQNYDGRSLPAPGQPPTVLSNRPVKIPRTYNVSVVVFAKRDVRDFNPTISPALQNLPVSERTVRVSDISADALTSGSFTMTVDASPLINAKIKVGDWLMMSRFTSLELLPKQQNRLNATFVSRQVHRWYRVVGVSGEDTFPRSIRVSGKPWNWTDAEINDSRQRNLALPILPPSPGAIETHAVLLRDVVHVYERQVELR